jgi:nitrogen-specific signal transduction histidine kinase
MPTPTTDGTDTQVLVVLRDVSTVALPPAVAHAQDRLLLLAQLASSVSHEIYNPLNAILLHADILEEELSQPDGMDRIPEDLGALLEAFGLEGRERLLAHGITFTLHGTADIGPVPLHKPAFWRALCNVEQYAVEAMPQGGTLTLHGQRCESHIRLDMHHTGAALSETQISCLTSPASAVHSAGKGLGLSLVREVILAHHGQIAVASTPGTGTTITVTLPLRTVEGPPAA